MTDKQIEQVQKSLKWVVNQIPEYLGDSEEEKMLKCIRLYCKNGAEAINLLKAEKEQIRKETAKEILQDISDTYEKEVLYGTPTVREKIEELAALYQVEVEVNE